MPRKGTRVRWFLAGVFAVLWLFTGFAATSAELHHCLHEDSSSAHHQCLFTKYAEGQFLGAPEAQLSARVAFPSSTKAQLAVVFELSSAINLLPPGRAPPVP